MKKPVTARSGSTMLSVLLLLAAVAFLALIALQVLEFLHYRSAPSVWPA